MVLYEQNRKDGLFEISNHRDHTCFFHAITIAGYLGSCLNNRLSAQTSPEGPDRC